MHVKLSFVPFIYSLESSGQLGDKKAISVMDLPLNWIRSLTLSGQSFQPKSQSIQAPQKMAAATPINHKLFSIVNTKSCF